MTLEVFVFAFEIDRCHCIFSLHEYGFKTNGVLKISRLMRISLIKHKFISYKVSSSPSLPSWLKLPFTDKGRSLNIVPFIINGHSKQITASHSDMLH